MIYDVEEILDDVRKFVKEENFDNIIRLLVMNTHKNNEEDVDIFFEVKDNTNRFKLICQTSALAARLTINYNILISIYPVLSETLLNNKNQFAINLSSRSREF